MTEEKLIKDLEISQKLFLERLKNENNSGMYVNIETTEELESFCWAMTFKYAYKDILRNPSNFKGLKSKNDERRYLDERYKNHLLGKAGEMVVKKILGDLIEDVNFGIHENGDSGFDFKLKDNPAFKVQVKTRRGDLDTIEWSISQREVDSNTILVCVHAKDNLEFLQNTSNRIDKCNYQFTIAGFLPIYKILEVSNNKEEKVIRQSDGFLIFKLRIEDLLHHSGLRNYLNIVSNEIWKVIGNRVSQVQKTRFNGLIPSRRPENKLLEFNSLLKQAHSHFVVDDFNETVEICNNALTKYEEFYANITNFLRSDLNFTSRNDTLEKFRIHELNLRPKNIYIKHKLVLPIFYWRGIARLNKNDFEGAQSDFLIFILLDEVEIGVNEFPLSKHISSSGNTEGYAITSANILACYYRGCSLFYLKKYDWALKIFDEVINFIISTQTSDYSDLLVASYKFKSNIFKARKNYNEAAIFSDQAVKANLVSSKTTLSKSDEQFRIEDE
ncbi:MAG: hypothetical protein WBA57_18310 [Elainellaceae cyanobacterium]